MSAFFLTNYNCLLLTRTTMKLMKLTEEALMFI